MKEYVAPAILLNGHLETVYPSLFRKVKSLPYRRERIATPDDDFLDLDWMRRPDQSKKLVIISHGLEGNADRAYVRGMAKAFVDKGIEALAWNFRGCGDELNRQKYFYHSGASHDLDTVVTHAISTGRYTEIYLIGFSLGGNMTLKYLGEKGATVPSQIKKAVVFSVPMDLKAGCETISRPGNWIYSRRFVKSLIKKVVAKAALYRDIDIAGIEQIKTLLEFDNRYTAPLHGFNDALHYYSESSANKYVSQITVPTLIVNAKNDPFLGPECSPVSLLMHHPYVRLETPRRGGHVGFALFNPNGLYWSELRALAFITS